MSDQLQISGQNADEIGLDDTGADADGDADEYGQAEAEGPWPGGLGQGAFARGGEDYPADPGPARSNRLAFAGLVLAVLFWPAGLVLSVIGLVKSRGLGGAGRMFAVFGLVVSVVFAVVTGVVVDHVLTETAADPGCAVVESGTVSANLNKLVHDDNAVAREENATTVDQAAVSAAIANYVSDLKVYQGELDHAVAVSVHSTVKSAISTMDQNVGIILTDYEALQANDPSKGTEAMAASGRLPADASAIDDLCTSL